MKNFKRKLTNYLTIKNSIYNHLTNQKPIIMKRIILKIFLLTGMITWGQNRYLTEVFPNVTTTSNVVFSTNISTIKTTNLFGNRIANEESYGQVSTTLKMDIYQPTGDTNLKRPVIIFAFGGGFVNGSRTEASMVKLCQSFAKRGFVTASIDYRLGMNINDEELSKRAVYRGIQDGRSAVRFFRKNAGTYNVDGNKIFISGHSAGGFLALHNVFLDKDNERPASTRLFMNTRPDLGGLDAVGDNKTYSNGTLVNGKANGAVALAGALGNITYIENSSDVPAAFFHSSDDNTVPYNSGEPFSTLSWLPGFNLPIVYGGNALTNRATAVGAPKELNPYTNRGHNVHYDGSNLYSDIAPKISQFLYSRFLAPGTLRIDGNTTICSTCAPETYVLNENSTKTDWIVNGGKIIDSKNNTITIQWDKDDTQKNIVANTYSSQLAKGENINLAIVINNAPTITKDLNVLNSYKNVNLNDYFHDIEGTPITYRAYNSKNELLNDESNNNVLSLTSLNEEVIVEAKDANNCKTIQKISPKNISTNDFVVVSPNPFSSELSIKLDYNFKSETTLEILDLNGRIIMTKIISTQDLEAININEIKNSGIYILKVRNNKLEFEQKIIKK
jgi:poly(3-hydroxybutyrate) depolymerase